MWSLLQAQRGKEREGERERRIRRDKRDREREREKGWGGGGGGDVISLLHYLLVSDCLNVTIGIIRICNFSISHLLIYISVEREFC